MRAENNNGIISVRAVAGSYVVLLGINMKEAETDGLLGFGIERTDNKTGETKPLEGLKSFRQMNVAKGRLVSTLEHPVQDFLWSDFTVRNRRSYTYRIIAFVGQPGNLQEHSSISVTVNTENEAGATHAVYFNRGVAGSQAYARKFENKHPKDVPNREAWRWLSRGLYKAMLDFIGQAKDDAYGLRAAVCEFNQGGVLKAFAKAAQAKADVEIIFDAREVIKRDANDAIIEDKGKLDPCKANREAVEKAGIKAFCTERTADPNTSRTTNSSFCSRTTSQSKSGRVRRI